MSEVSDMKDVRIAELEQRLAEAEQLIEAIKSGEVDAFALNRENGPEIFTLESGDFAYRVLVENFGEGALNLTEDGLIVYTNTYFHELLGLPYEKVIGHFIFEFIHPDCKEIFNDLFAKGLNGQSKGEIIVQNNGRSVPVYVSLTSLMPNLTTIGMVITDLTEKKEYETSLMEKNAFIETLLDSSVDMIIVVDREYRHIALNKTARNIYQQFFPGDPIGKTIFEVNPNAAQTLPFDDLVKCFEGHEMHRKEYKSSRSDNYYDIDYIPISRNHDVDIVMIMLRDVTDKVAARENLLKANQKLKERNEFIETIIDSSHELIAVYDTSFTLLSVNKAAEKLMNRPREELIGKTLTEIYPNAKNTKGEADLLRAFKGEFVQNEPYRSQLTGRYIQNYITPLFDENGEIYAALAIAHDVTEIKKTEEQLIKSQHLFSTLFSVNPVAMALSQASDGRIIEVNAAWEKLFNLYKVDVIGKTTHELNLTDPGEKLRNAQTMMEAGGHLGGMEMKYNVPGKPPLYVYLSVENIDIDGIPCFITAYFDLSERKKAEEKIKKAKDQLESKNEELAQSNTELASFSYIASHDLQEPLRKIQTFSNRILEKSKHELSPLTLDYFYRIIAASFRMQNLITALLNYSRMNSADLDFEKVDMNMAVVEVKTNLAELFEESKAVIKSKALPVLEVIPLQFNQLLTNIFTNAIKYRKEGIAPVIEIESEFVTEDSVPIQPNTSGYYKITFKDNGIGFDSRYAEKIFELFQRLHGKLEYEGTGIGLAICKKIIQNHKGYIKAEGFPGVGAVFTIYIPKHNENGKESHPPRG